MKTSCDCKDKPKYSSLELANRIDACTDIVSRQQNTIDAQEHTIETEIQTATEIILQAIHELEPGTHVDPIPANDINGLFDTSFIVKRYEEGDEPGQCAWAYVNNSMNASLDDNLNWDDIITTSLFFSDTDTIENGDIVTSNGGTQYYIEGNEGEYEYTEEQPPQCIYHGILLRLVKV